MSGSVSSARLRAIWLLGALFCLPLGLATRLLKRHFDALGSALGDGLWALLVFCLVCGVAPRWPLAWRVLTALTLAVLVEVSQLWHFPWLVALRHTRLGALAIGGSFSFGDILCYATGIAFGALLARRFER
ncbi:DUF2809 domain-containing protein [Armatimonas sp.]|uniref:ribosomal maturation YjgA family protein n=1 Tax=Armatimonas sp. TaxID=1872638 RepID=UPI00286B522D|nr:DUF2809 domain-containing protein [Armatimonas sp.]